MAHKRTKADLEREIGELRSRVDERDETVRKLARRLCDEESRREDLEAQIGALRADRYELARLVGRMSGTIETLAGWRSTATVAPNNRWSVVASRTYEDDCANRATGDNQG